MEHETGDAYVRRVAAFVRANERGLAEAGYVRRRPRARRSATNVGPSFNPISWFAGESQPRASLPPKPVTFAIDMHRLFYILMRFEALGLHVGPLDVTVDDPSRPMHYTHIDVPHGLEKSDTLSLTSLRSSLSVVSGLSLGVGWRNKTELQSIDAELKYLYSSFTKLPALSIRAPGPKVIEELAGDLPTQNALPLDAFKNLSTLECIDIDPRALLGWDRLAEGLRSLVVKRSGLEDVTDIFIAAVQDDQAQSDSASESNRRRLRHRRRSFSSTIIPPSVPEEGSSDPHHQTLPSPAPVLSPYKWSLLKYLSLADNALTFLPTDPLPYLTSVTHLDLSSNLFVSVPHGLSLLHDLVFLNLADNMIDSVRGIYTQLGQVLYLNLSGNRLESICGMERLMALERVDLRSNHIDESAEIGRLATLPNIAEVWIEGNPFTEIEERYRIACFDLFAKEGKLITLDGTSPSLMERLSVVPLPTAQTVSTKTVSEPSSATVSIIVPKTIASASLSALDVPGMVEVTPRPTTPLLGVGTVSRHRKRRSKRIVALDGDGDGCPCAPTDRSRPQGLETRTSTSPRIPSPLSSPPSHRRFYSVFEPPDATVEAESQNQLREAEVYRARIEALRSDVGEGWLKVFSESHVSSPAAS